MSNYKWGEINEDRTRPLRVCLMISRHKDNDLIAKTDPNYRERRKAFLTRSTPEELEDAFADFVNKGREGEWSRMYLSVNARDEEKIRKQLIHYLVDDINIKYVSFEAKLAGIAATRECALEKKWMFDFDSEDTDLLYEFLTDINTLSNEIKLEVHHTPHGYAVITSRGFNAIFKDGTILTDKWKDTATLKRDDMLCVKWAVKH